MDDLVGGPGLVTPLVLGPSPVTDTDSCGCVLCRCVASGMCKSLELGALPETPGPGSKMEMCVLESGGSGFLITETLFIV